MTWSKLGMQVAWVFAWSNVGMEVAMAQMVNVITGEVIEVEPGQLFFTQFLRPLPKGDAVDSVTTKTVQEHIDTTAQIREMMEFGMRVDAHRAAQAREAYGTDALEEGADPMSLSPGIPRGADLVDVQRISEALEAKLTAEEGARAKVRAEEAAAAAAKAASDAADLERLRAAEKARSASQEGR